MRTGRGQLGDVDMKFHRPALGAIADQLSDYAASEIHNCDETGLYLKIMSTRTLPQGRVKETKSDTDAWVSTLLCCNADGPDKKKSFVLCKLRYLHALPSSISVYYLL